MKRHSLLTLAAAALVAMAAGRVDAQTSGKRADTGYIHVDGGVQAGTSAFTSNVTFKLNGEDGTMTASYRFVSAGVVAGRAGVRIGGNLYLGVGVSRFDRAGSAAITARLPNPFYFNQFRNVSGVVNDLNRDEVMTSAELSWLVRPARAVDVMLFAGPAYFTTRQEMATLPRYSEVYPFDSATLTGVDSRTVRKTGVGFTAGLDLSYLVNRHVGFGGLVRFSRATASFSPVPGSSTSVRLGGVQATAGLRLRF
ncbi:MAG: hypothetical protein NTV05_01590 [Acidobacteria bacterium]|nr:hypothetical protein [Acidobacteriota bacterium]